MIKVLFRCHGNICRSPMAEFVMKDLVRKAGAMSGFLLPRQLPARRRSEILSIPLLAASWQNMASADYREYDLLIGMDSANLRNMRRICGGDPEGKIRLLMDFTDRPGDVADPWYTGDFETTWRDISAGCRGLLEWLS